MSQTTEMSNLGEAVRNWAKDSDCADCGQSEASFRFRGMDAICEDCAPQYSEGDLTEN